MYVSKWLSQGQHPTHGIYIPMLNTPCTL